MRRPNIRYVLGLAVVVAAAAGLGGSGQAASTAVFPGGAVTLVDCCNNSGAATGTPSTAAQYPSTITVSGIPGAVTNLKVTVVLDHQWPDDVDLLLVSPSGAQKVILMADVAGNAGNAITPDTLTFSGSGGAIPDGAQLQTGTYAPTNGGSDCDNATESADAFPAPAPAGPYGSALSAFNGTTGNGAWKLYAVDDCNLGNTLGASITSWSLEINGPTAVSVRSFTAKRAKPGVQLRWRTGAEAAVLGFDVYRFSAGKRMAKVNRKLIPAKRSGSGLGATYTLIDRSVRARLAATYRLRVVTLAGKRQWAATASIKTSR